jgi:hypothetical protein
MQRAQSEVSAAREGKGEACGPPAPTAETTTPESPSSAVSAEEEGGAVVVAAATLPRPRLVHSFTTEAFFASMATFAPVIDLRCVPTLQTEK